MAFNDIENFLTEEEVAQILRCSVSKIRYLRRNGRLSYIKGRPPLIGESDLKAYIDGLKVHARPTPVKPQTITSDGFTEGQKRARQVWLKYHGKHR